MSCLFWYSTQYHYEYEFTASLLPRYNFAQRHPIHLHCCRKIWEAVNNIRPIHSKSGESRKGIFGKALLYIRHLPLMGARIPFLHSDGADYFPPVVVMHGRNVYYMMITFYPITHWDMSHRNTRAVYPDIQRNVWDDNIQFTGDIVNEKQGWERRR